MDVGGGGTALGGDGGWNGKEGKLAKLGKLNTKFGGWVGGAGGGARGISGLAGIAPQKTPGAEPRILVASSCVLLSTEISPSG